MKTFLLKAIVCSAKFDQTFAKNHSSSLLFFLAKLPSLKVYTKFIERRTQRRIQNSIKHLRWSFLHK